MSICRILLVMPAASVAIASALRKNHSLGKTFWFTVYLHHYLLLNLIYIVLSRGDGHENILV
ncbi:MAG: hypothetical protein HCA27_27785 [Dolichospermum sp. DET67]|nr:hypothetical protein [Dolichospermum sp. DET67]MBS3036059.1 hypothetical protein [Dolichospermum sp. DET67]